MVAYGGNIASSPPPGGASSANLLLLARIRGQQIRQIVRVSPSMWLEVYDKVRLDRQDLRSVVAEAAEALQVDPWNAELLNNLAILFDYLGELEKAKVAQQLLV